MIPRTRTYRRLQDQRKKREARLRAKEHGWSTSEKSVGMMATTPVPCSAECCGNVRNHSGNSECGKTMQELRHTIDPHEAVIPQDDE